MSEKFRTFAQNNKTLMIMKKTTYLENVGRVETYDLSTEQHDIAVDILGNNKRKVGSYTLEEVDDEMANVWIADAFSEGEEEYAHFLQKVIADGAELYTLKDHLGDFSQPIGEVAVYDC